MNKNQPPGSSVGQQQINIELPPEQAEGTYSNLAIITHSPAEFVIDFTRIVPGIPKAKVYSRIIMTPQHAKSFLKALEENIQKYEAQHGEIKLTQGSNQGRSFGFQPPQSESK
ncbi:MAG: DUF3467 domain-containing protein [Calditrichaeota bacterium]|nr:MAG: DUF3467 domain-containing protein [Calditrichota bacterium]